MLLLWPFQA
jgi:hypothetical protein